MNLIWGRNEINWNKKSNETLTLKNIDTWRRGRIKCDSVNSLNEEINKKKVAINLVLSILFQDQTANGSEIIHKINKEKTKQRNYLDKSKLVHESKLMVLELFKWQ